MRHLRNGMTGSESTVETIKQCADLLRGFGLEEMEILRALWLKPDWCKALDEALDEEWS
jgi:hypothetical protein